MMIILDNYSTIGTYIILESSGYSIVEEDEELFNFQGVGGFTEDGELVGIYVKDNKLFFYYNGKSFEASAENLICTNQYISRTERCFRVTIGEQKICEIVYKPYIDPGMIYYDADPEEFDVLLYLSNLLKTKDSIKRFMNGMEMVKKMNEG